MMASRPSLTCVSKPPDLPIVADRVVPAAEEQATRDVFPF